MGYSTWKEDEAYRDGYNDGRYGRRDYFRDEHFGNDADKAYYDGLREAEREEEERRREIYEQERKQEEIEERRREEHRQYMRDLEEQEYYAQMEQQQYPEPLQQYTNDGLPF